MQYDVNKVYEIFRYLFYLESQQNPYIDERKEAILFAKSLYLYTYGNQILLSVPKEGAAHNVCRPLLWCG